MDANGPIQSSLRVYSVQKDHDTKDKTRTV